MGDIDLDLLLQETVQQLNLPTVSVENASTSKTAVINNVTETLTTVTVSATKTEKNVKGLSFDPLKKSLKSKKPASASLPTPVQRLRDDTIQLVKEANFGVQSEPLRTFEGASTSGQRDGPSSTAQNLLQHTRSLVDEYAKTSGIPASQGTGAARGAGGSLPGLGPMAGLGSLLSGLGTGEGGAGGMDFVVEQVMRNLLSKDILYGPLKDIRDKYTPWLEANRSTLPAEQLARYEAQYASIVRVCQQYEDNPDDFTKLVELIQEMQAHGDPPPGIVEDITGGCQDELSGLLGNAPGSFGEGAEDDLPFDMPDLANLSNLSPQELQNQMQQQCQMQ